MSLADKETRDEHVNETILRADIDQIINYIDKILDIYQPTELHVDINKLILQKNTDKIRSKVLTPSTEKSLSLMINLVHLMLNINAYYTTVIQDIKHKIDNKKYYKLTNTLINGDDPIKLGESHKKKMEEYIAIISAGNKKKKIQFSDTVIMITENKDGNWTKSDEEKLNFNAKVHRGGFDINIYKQYKSKITNYSDMFAYNALFAEYSTDAEQILSNAVKDDNDYKKIRTELQLQPSITHEIDNMVTERIKQSLTTLYNTIHKQYNVGDNFLNSKKRDEYVEIFRMTIDKNITDGVRTLVTQYKTISHTTLATDSPAKTFFNDVYKNWAIMSKDVRDFYMQNIALFAHTKSDLYNSANNAFRSQSLLMDWIKLTEDEIDNLLKKPLNRVNYENLRVNLMKDKKTGFKTVLFASNLPDVPDEASVWYTKADGTKAVVSDPLPKSFLRDLYTTVYTNTGTDNTYTIISSGDKGTINKFVINIATNLQKRPKKEFNLNHSKFLSAVFKRGDDSVNKPSDTEMPEFSFLNDHDMVYNVDTNNNTQVYNDTHIENDVKTCYATYLDKGSKDCKRVIECILLGDSKSLNRCMNVIGDGSFWNVANDDVQKVAPDRVKQILRKFGVDIILKSDVNGTTYNEPITYNEWKHKVVANFPSDVNKAIFGNQKLLEYIQGVIAVCRAKPSILNKNKQSVIVRNTASDYMTSLGIQKYKILGADADRSAMQIDSYVDTFLNIPQPNPVTQDMFNPIINGHITNVGYSMFGGNPTGNNTLSKQYNGSSSTIETALRVINATFTEIGLKLHDNDQRKINDMINQLKKYEVDLARVCALMISIVRLAKFHNIGLENIDKINHQEIKLGDHNTLEEIHTIIRQRASRLAGNMTTNVSMQQLLLHDLFSKIMPSILKRHK